MSVPVGSAIQPKLFHSTSATSTNGSGVETILAGRIWERSSVAPAAAAKKADGASQCALKIQIPPHLSRRVA